MAKTNAECLDDQLHIAKDQVISRQQRQIMRLQKALTEINDLAKTMRERVTKEFGTDYLHGRADGSDDCAVIARNALADQIGAL